MCVRERESCGYVEICNCMEARKMRLHSKETQRRNVCKRDVQPCEYRCNLKL